MSEVTGQNNTTQVPAADDAKAPAPKNATSANPEPRSRSAQFVEKRLPIVISIISLVASILSLAITVFHFYQDYKAPSVEMFMPVYVRLGAPSPANNSQFIIVQPTFINTGTSQLREIISDLKVEVTSDADTKPVEFRWTQMGTLTVNPDTQNIDYHFLADPSALLSAPAAPIQPVGRFNGPTGWTFEARKYHITLVATRSVVQTPLIKTVDITLNDSNAQDLQRNDGHNHIFHIDSK